MNYIVGVTGGIGSGKTTVTERFEQHGIEVVDADVIARAVVEPESHALQEIAKKFGHNILQPDGSLNRAALRRLIFQNESHKKWLNALLHPLIRQRTMAALHTAASPYVILSAPLLLENNLNAYTQRVLVVDVSVQTQMNRTTQRDNNSPEQVQAIIDAQIDRSSRLARADDVINNEGSLADTLRQVDKLHQQYLQFAKQQPRK